MSMLGRPTDRGRVVIVRNPQHRFVGERAVVQWATPAMYHVRLLDRRRPTIERLTFDANGVCCASAKSPYITFYIAKRNVRFDGTRTARTEMNTWFRETLALMDDYGGKSRREVASAAARVEQSSSSSSPSRRSSRAIRGKRTKQGV